MKIIERQMSVAINFRMFRGDGVNLLKKYKISIINLHPPSTPWVEKKRFIKFKN